MPAVIVDENQPSDNLGPDTTALRDSTLPDETTPAPAPAPEPAPAPVPDKYAGKTAAELIAMHNEAEKLIGRQSQELGSLRETHDKYLLTALEAAQRQPAPSTKQDAPDDDVDYFLNPKAAIEKAVSNHPLVKELAAKQGQSQKDRAQAAFEAKHPDAKDVMQDPGFADWVKASPARLKRLEDADRYDFDAADDLFSTYKEIKAAKTTVTPAPAPVAAPRDTAAADAARAAALKAGKVPSGNASPQGTPTGKLYRRSDLMRLRNTDPERYEAMGPEILAAYAEKRVING